jgi:sigma-B regulation protein RsbU (phosphoserine phosphatase)
MDSPAAARFGRGSERRRGSAAIAAERRNDARRQRDLAWIPLFKDADKDAVNAALADCVIITLPAGSVLLKPGQDNDTIYIALSGQVDAYLDAIERPETAIPMAPGECIGELSAIDGRPVSAYVVTRSEARILKVPRDVFWDRLMILPKVARNLRIMLSDRVRRSSEMMLAAQREQLELQHLRKELDVARRLQAGMLPLQRPLFPEHPELAVAGFMEPTARVGGDLFDAFFVRDHHLFFCIGDVTGHGVAAALFMARTVGLLRMLALRTLHPERVLEELNAALCQGNDTEIFITLLCGYLDTHSGRLVYSNAGHCAPILVSGGATQRLPLPRGPLLGAMPGIRYSALRHTLALGQTLFCFTDGVTEASNGDGEEFSEVRCEALVATASEDLEGLLDRVRQAVRSFTGTDALEDDCTMLALRRIAVPPTPTLAADAHLTQR